MKFWKGLSGTPKQGMFGTMNDDGFVPDSIAATKVEYDFFVSGTVPEVPKKTIADLLLAKGIINQAEYDEVK